MDQRHSQEGLTRKGRVSVKLLIGDRGFKRTGTLDIGERKTPKPEIESGKDHG
jgi:hypothetical protein